MQTSVFVFLYGGMIFRSPAAAVIKEGIPPNPVAKTAIAPDFMKALLLAIANIYFR
jgi:hypothetical protein